MRFGELPIGARFYILKNADTVLWIKIKIPDRFPDGLSDEDCADIRALNLQSAEIKSFREDMEVAVMDVPSVVGPVVASGAGNVIVPVRNDERYEQLVAELTSLMAGHGLSIAASPKASTVKPLIPLVALKEVRAVMGNNLFDAQDWTKYYNVQWTPEQLRDIPPFPWDLELLNSPCPFNPGKCIKDTHVAFLGMPTINESPLTVQKWRELHPATGQPKFYYNNNSWHEGQPHTDVETMQLRWYLMLKEIISDSTSKTPEEQVAMLPEGYAVPTTIMEVTKDILVFQKTGEYLNKSRWAACAERTVKTNRVSAGGVSCVGDFVESGLGVGSWSGDRNGDVGLGASRKF